MQELPRAARLTAWGNAALHGGTSLDDAADAVTGGDDAPHRVFGLDGEPGGVSVGYALGRLRSAGATGLRLVLPRPGDLTGLAGPPSFNERATSRGEVVLTVAGPPVALLPEGRGAWTVHQVSPDPRPVPTLRDAERELARVTREAAETLARLDVARFEPVAAEVLAHQSSRLGPRLPLAFPPQAHHVLDRSMRLLTIVELARRTEGGAVTSAEMRSRAEVLRDLDAVGRRGIEAACGATTGAGEGQDSDR